MKAPSEKIVSLGDIAQAVGVSRMTVSLALRNRIEVSEQTRESVIEAAKNLGYFPDPEMANRMACARNAKKQERSPIAWIDMNEAPGFWHTSPCISPYLLGAKERCEELGYDLQEFSAREPGMTMKRLGRILYNRGIRGAIVAPPGGVDLVHIQLNWESMACVSFGKGVIAPGLHQVTQDIYYNLMLTLKLLRRFGYGRIGVVLQRMANRRSYHMLQAGLGYFQSTLSKESVIKPFHFYKAAEAYVPFRAWIHENRPDVIVGQDSRLRQWIADAGFKVPEEVGLVHLALDDDCLDWAGIHAQKKEIGAATANMVISLVQNHRFGLPEVPIDTRVQGRWQPGKTLLIPKPKKSMTRLS